MKFHHIANKPKVFIKETSKHKQTHEQTTRFQTQPLRTHTPSSSLSSAIANRHVWLQYCTVFGSCCTYAIKLAWTYIQMYGSITASQTWLNTWLTCLYAPRCSMWQSVYMFYDFMCSMAIPAPIMAITTCFGEPLPPRWLPKPQLLAPAPSADLGPWKHCPQSPPLHWSSGCLPQNGS